MENNGSLHINDHDTIIYTAKGYAKAFLFGKKNLLIFLFFIDITCHNDDRLPCR